jgi:hypothetical protein
MAVINYQGASSFEFNHQLECINNQSTGMPITSLTQMHHQQMASIVE